MDINHSLYIEEGTANLVLQIVITIFFLFKDKSMATALFRRFARVVVSACGGGRGGGLVIPAAAAVCRCRAPGQRRPRDAVSLLGQNSCWQLLSPLDEGAGLFLLL